MSKLTTDFRKIGQSGPTIDGRIIKPEWLLQAAEAYAQTTYTALIWPEHFRWMNYGKVVELKAVEEGGVVSLYARLQPNGTYVWENQFGQRLFFSMEIEPNFAGTGKAYLVGLGITDSPASLGTDEMRFSQRRQSPGSVFVSNVECDFPAKTEAEPSWFARFRETFFRTASAPDNDNQEDSMDPKQFEALQGRVEALSKSVEEIKGQVATFAAKPATPDEPAQPETQAAPAAQPEPDKFAAVAEAVTKLSEQVADMAKRFEAARPGATVPPSTAPAGDQAPIY